MAEGWWVALERLWERWGQRVASRRGRCPGEGNSLQTPVWTPSRDWHVFSVKGQAVNILLCSKNKYFFLIEVMLVYNIT